MVPVAVAVCTAVVVQVHANQPAVVAVVNVARAFRNERLSNRMPVRIRAFAGPPRLLEYSNTSTRKCV